MELFLKDGDYLPDGKGGFRRVEGREELLQRVLWKLTARRGRFPFLPALGSRLHTLSRAKPSEWESLARQYAAEALEDEADLTVKGAEVWELGGRLGLTLYLDWKGEALDVKMDLREE